MRVDRVNFSSWSESQLVLPIFRPEKASLTLFLTEKVQISLILKDYPLSLCKPMSTNVLTIFTRALRKFAKWTMKDCSDLLAPNSTEGLLSVVSQSIAAYCLKGQPPYSPMGEKGIPSWHAQVMGTKWERGPFPTMESVQNFL